MTPPIPINQLNEAIQAFSTCNVCGTRFGYTMVDYPTYEDLPLTLEEDPDEPGRMLQVDLEDCPDCDGSLLLS